ncbi:MAG: 23S rRNA (uracil(1939)-C(5))-methyltransferase RlmD [Acidobacteriota bacterium]
MQIEITGLNHQGEGVGRIDGIVYFVPFTVPGDTVEIEETAVQKNFRRGRLVSVTQASPDRVKAACARQEICGGSNLHHIAYDAQLRWKTQLVKDALQRIGGLENVQVEPTLGMDNPYHYRNKAVFHRDRQNGKIGFYKQGTHQVITAADCCIVPQEWLPIINDLEQIMNDPEIRASAVDSITMRQSVASGQIMVAITGRKNLEPSFWVECARVLKPHKQVVSLVAIDDQGRTRVIEGRSFLNEKIDNLTYRISPTSFFQTNTQVAGILAKTAVDFCELSGRETVVDAYCGIGTIALPIARQAVKVIGIESLTVAVKDATANAKENGLNNTEFITGMCEEILPNFVAENGAIDIIVVDPPRKGLEPEVIDAIGKAKPGKVVYVSCHTGTLARDLGRLSELGYKVSKVQPVDMFPHTPLVETVVACKDKMLKDNSNVI